MARHRRVSAKRKGQANPLAVLAFLGLLAASPGLATAAADTGESTSTSAEAPDAGPSAQPADPDPEPEAEEPEAEELEEPEVEEPEAEEPEEPEVEEPEDARRTDDDPPAAEEAISEVAPEVPEVREEVSEQVEEPAASPPEVEAKSMFSAAADASADDEARAPGDWLPDYPTIPGVTETEVAAVVFVAAAAVTVVSIPTAPLLTIPLLFVTLAAWARFEDLGTNHHAPTASAGAPTRVLGVLTGTLHGDDEDGDPVGFTIENGPANGSVVLVGNQYIYTADNPFTVGAINDSFTVKVDDYGGWRNHPLGMHSFTMTVNVVDGGVIDNLPPLVLPVSTALPDRAGVVRGSVLGTDPEGGPLTYTVGNGQQSIVTSNGGIVHLDGDDYVYIPPRSGGLLGAIVDSFQIAVSDADGATTPVTVGIVTVELDFDFTGVFDGATKVTGEIDAPADDVALFTYALGDGPAAGGVDIDAATGAYVYTAGGAAVDDEFTVVGTDAFGNQVTFTVEVRPFGENHDPTVLPVGVGLPDVVSGVVTGAVLGTDIDGDPLQYSVAGYGGAQAAVLSNGALVVVDSDGTWTYIPPRDGGGLLGTVVDDFTIYVTDGRGGQASTVIGIVTHDLSIGVTKVPAVGAVTGGLSIPSALDGVLTYGTTVDAPAGVTVNPDGTFSYTGATEVSFVIVGSVAGASITVAEVTATPLRPNTAPTATYAVTGHSATNLGAASVGSAEGAITVTDSDGDTEFTYVVSGSTELFPRVGTTEKGGVVTVGTDGTFTYTSAIGLPHSSAPGGTTDSFTVTVSDGFGGSTEVHITVPVDPVNNQPSQVTNIGASGRDLYQRTGTWTLTVADVDLDGLSWSKSATTKGSVEVSQTGYLFVITYTSHTAPQVPIPFLQPGIKSPTETFTVVITDGHGGSLERTYTF